MIDVRVAKQPVVSNHLYRFDPTRARETEMYDLPPDLYLQLQRSEMARHLQTQNRFRTARLRRQARRDGQRVARATRRLDRAEAEVRRARGDEARSKRLLHAASAT